MTGQEPSAWDQRNVLGAPRLTARTQVGRCGVSSAAVPHWPLAIVLKTGNKALGEQSGPEAQGPGPTQRVTSIVKTRDSSMGSELKFNTQAAVPCSCFGL